MNLSDANISDTRTFMCPECGMQITTRDDPAPVCYCPDWNKYPGAVILMQEMASHATILLRFVFDDTLSSGANNHIQGNRNRAQRAKGRLGIHVQ